MDLAVSAKFLFFSFFLSFFLSSSFSSSSSSSSSSSFAPFFSFTFLFLLLLLSLSPRLPSIKCVHGSSLLQPDRVTVCGRRTNQTGDNQLCRARAAAAASPRWNPHHHRRLSDPVWEQRGVRHAQGARLGAGQERPRTKGLTTLQRHRLFINHDRSVHLPHDVYATRKIKYIIKYKHETRGQYKSFNYPATVQLTTILTSFQQWRQRSQKLQCKEKEEYIASFYYACIVLMRSDMDHTVLPANNHTCMPFFVSVYRMALPLTEVRDTQLQLTTHLSTPKGWNAELAWLVDLTDGLPT